MNPLRSQHTVSFPRTLREERISLVVSTYQAGKLIVLRADGERLNTHFRIFDRPMGLAYEGGRLAIGTSMQVTEFHNLPAVASKIEADDASITRNCDACFLPRSCHWTGDIQIHEMNWIHQELHFVNTRFGCVARRSSIYNFDPIWYPHFVRHCLPNDPCHLNGMSVRDGELGYVTALGETDSPQGWRANKKNGGIVIDCRSNEVIARGLSMPHSPRWWRGKLWLLESGTGSVGYLEERTGRFETVVTLPGFARGFAIHEGKGFVGLSQVRETATFGDLPITSHSGKERLCGVWVVELSSGRIEGFVRFDDAVQEIFAVEVLPGILFPEVIDDHPELVANSFELPDDAVEKR